MAITDFRCSQTGTILCTGRERERQENWEWHGLLNLQKSTPGTFSLPKHVIAIHILFQLHFCFYNKIFWLSQYVEGRVYLPYVSRGIKVHYGREVRQQGGSIRAGTES